MREWHETIRETLRFGRAWINYPRKAASPVNPANDVPTIQITTGEQVFYEHAVRALDWQIRSGDTLDLKIATWFTLVTVLLPVVAALLGAEHTRLNGPHGKAAVLFSILGAAVWIVIVGILYRAYVPNQWEIGPKWTEFEQAAKTHGARSVFIANGHFIVTDSIPRNENLLRRKARSLSWAVRLFPLEFILFAVSVTISLF